MVAQFGAATTRTAAREIDRRRAVLDCARTDRPRSNAVVGCAESPLVYRGPADPVAAGANLGSNREKAPP